MADDAERDDGDIVPAIYVELTGSGSQVQALVPLHLLFRFLAAVEHAGKTALLFETDAQEAPVGAS